MKIALIYPRIGMYRELLGTDGYVENMSTYPPLSLAYAAAVIRRAGHEAVIIDGNIQKLDLPAVCRRIREFSPDALGFTLTAPTFPPVFRWIRELKERFGLPVLAGGGLLKLYPAEVMAHAEIDYGFIGMGHTAIPAFLKGFGDGNGFEEIPGFCFRKGGRTVINRPEDVPEDMDDLPFPARDLLPLERYRSPFSEKRFFTPFLTSRGCLFRCSYCCLPGSMRMRKLDGVLAELEECFFRFRIRDIDMYDTVFTADKKRVMDLCAGIRKKKMRISWMARTHINLVDDEMLREMAAAGCRMLMYGIESLDEGILKNLGRPAISPVWIRDQVGMTRKAGISAFGFFMLGCPGETEETMAKTVRASRTLGLDFAQFTRLTPIGGTPLYERYKQVYRQDYWSEMISGPVRDRQMNPLDTALSAGAIVRSVRNANMGFYVRPFQIIRMITRVRNLRQFFNFLKAGNNMVFSFVFRRKPAGK